MQENPIAKYFLGYSWPLMKIPECVWARRSEEFSGEHRNNILIEYFFNFNETHVQTLKTFLMTMSLTTFFNDNVIENIRSMVEGASFRFWTQ